MKAKLELDPATLDDPALRRLLLEWSEIDWLQRGTSANAAVAARCFEAHHARAHACAPDFFAERVNVTARISSWTELAALCDAVRGGAAPWDWKFSGLKRLTRRHSEAHGWSLERAPQSPLFVRVGANVFWSLTTTLDLRELPPAAREPMNWYASYTAIDLSHALEWQLAEPGARLEDNPFVPLLRCYAAGFLPFMLDRETVTLWAFGT